MKNVQLLVVLLILTGCGGQSFTSSFGEIDSDSGTATDSGTSDAVSDHLETVVSDDAGTGGATAIDSGSGGATGSSGGTVGTGGEVSTGGVTNTGGTAGSTGGVIGADTGGAQGSGGTGTGGITGTGGAPATGGVTGTGGTPPPPKVCCKTGFSTFLSCDSSVSWSCSARETYTCGSGQCSVGETCFVPVSGGSSGQVAVCP